MTRLLAALALLLTTAAPSLAQQQIGQINTATGTVSVVRGGASKPIAVGEPVYQQDVVETGANSSVGITFVDNSVFSTGPGSSLSLDQFHFDSSSFKGDMLAKLKKGTLTVVSGDIARSSPGNMKIQTPTAILGVRGTTFAIEVQ